ncbi:MAG: segregation/condensation protein A [Actinomycetota bacterium]|nr:segregation/condensation protein A [Actinomycetota bacterium]
MPFEVKLKVFEGPFDLLLHLITSKEIDIYDIFIAEIACDYLGYIETLQSLDLEVATEFLLIAATLLKLKSDSLLPVPERGEEELAPAEMREELLWRLVEYQKFRNAAAELSGRREREERYFCRQVDLEEPFDHLVTDILKGLTLDGLSKAARGIIIPESVVDISYIAPVKVSLEDFIEKVRAILSERGSTSYRELTGECTLRIELIATFLALLEMYKREEIEIKQARRFGDIQVYALREG